MKQSMTPLWRKSCLEKLRYWDVIEYLDEIGENGDPYGYDSDEDGYYQEYKDQFDELSTAAYDLEEAMRELNSRTDRDYEAPGGIWDDVVVAILGDISYVLGYDGGLDYWQTLTSWEEDEAVREAKKRLSRLTKDELLKQIAKVMQCVSMFWDIKASHDCLVSIVTELDDRAAIMRNGKTAERMWVE